MKFEDEEAALLKQWIVKRIENVSDATADADPDVLAEFVLTLLGHDQPEEELRTLCATELQTFLENDAATGLVTDIFTALSTRSYIPGTLASKQPPTGPAFSAPSGPSNNRKKRSFGDVEDGDGRGMQQMRQGDRVFKQARRGGTRGGRGEPYGNRGGRPGQHMQPFNGPPGFNGASQPPFSGMPNMPQGFPNDFNQDPMGALLAMQQAMGMAPLHGMPEWSNSGQSIAPGQHSGAPGPPHANQQGTAQSNQICQSFQQQGRCDLGRNCPFLHPLAQFVGASPQEEYDPKAAIMPGFQNSRPDRGNRNDRSRANGMGRGSISGRGDRSGAPPSRRGDKADFSFSGRNVGRSISTIVVENIPEETFDESKVREFFEQFGVVNKIEMLAYKRLAIVHFDSHDSAKSAFQSPKVIFDNRFVKVYWYKPDVAHSTPGSNGFASKGQTEARSKPEDAMEEDKPDPEETAKKQAELQVQHEEKQKRKREAEELQAKLDEQKGALAKAHAEETRKLMEKLAARAKAKNPTASDAPAQETEATFEDEGDEYLDEEGKQLKRMLDSLKKKAIGMGIDVDGVQDDASRTALNAAANNGQRGRGQGRGGFRARGGFARGRGDYEGSHRGGYRGRGWAGGDTGRGGWVRPMKLDNRTRKVAVRTDGEFDAQRDEGLRQHLLSVGEYESLESDKNKTDSMVITFKDRYTAEKFFHSDSNIPNVGKAEFSWVNTPLPPIPAPPKQDDKGPDLLMGNENSESAGAAAVPAAPAVQVDYDVAEDDDRWMAD